MRFSARLVAVALVAGLAWSAGCSSAPGQAEDGVGTDEAEISMGARTCAQDRDCNHGVEGLGVVCLQTGTGKGTCADACHSDADCPGGGACNKSNPRWQCDDPLPRIGTPCQDDAFCSGVRSDGEGTVSAAITGAAITGAAITGAADGAEDGGVATLDPDALEEVEQVDHDEPSGRVCSKRTGTCIIGCHGDGDCPQGSTCDSSGKTHVCRIGDHNAKDDTDDDAPESEAHGAPATPGENACAPVTYPSGVSIVTKPDSALTAKYKALNARNCQIPRCFIDLKDLRTPEGKPLSLAVSLSEHFTLMDVVRTEASGKWSSRVLVDPKFVEKLEATRQIAGRTLRIGSGFRSPDHQRATCMSFCGCLQCVSNGRGGNRCGNGGGKVTCARNSRHMWGAAADLSLSFSSAARRAGFPFVYDEYGGSGPHLHIDMKACR